MHCVPPKTWHPQYHVHDHNKLENELLSIEDRGQTDRVTILAYPNPNP